MINLNSPLSEITRVGEANSKILRKLGLETVLDLLFYFPFRYDDFSDTKAISELKPGENINVIGIISDIKNRRSFKRRQMYITEALVSDESETIKVIWFNQPFLTKNLNIGDKVSLAGKISEKDGVLTMASPKYEKISSNNLIHTKGLIPCYHLSEKISQKQIRFLMKQIIPLAKNIGDWLPEKLIRELKLISIGETLNNIHFPEKQEDINAAQTRLAVSELFLYQLRGQLIKRALKERRAQKIEFKQDETKKFVASLPFKLTDSQRKAAWEILLDLEKNTPMSRLLEGDVGSGKTVVACLAMLSTALNKQQSILMVPTEILAKQHFNSIGKLLKKYKIKIGLLSRSQKEANFPLKNKTGKLIEQEIIKKSNIVIGTHSLIKENLPFKNLSLIIVDEQHRFGVNQRKKLLNWGENKNKTPHFLSMTATPIPRSLALAIYGDLDLSIINELPSGRKKIITEIIKNKNRLKTYNFIRSEIEKGRQAFVICPLIDESDKLGVKSVKQEFDILNQEIFPDFKIGLLHGKLKGAEKEKIMADFLKNKIKIIVATSIIEVGIDIPNATIMLIEGAERFGLAQLHQFRGRVGRDEAQSYCFISPSKENINNQKTIERLEAMTKYNDGLSLAKIDLKLRGTGEIYGIKQSGLSELQISGILSDELIKKTADLTAEIINTSPDLKKYPDLKNKLGQWDDNIHLE